MKDLLKLLACWIAFIFSVSLAGLLANVLHIPVLVPPGNTPPATEFLLSLASGALLVLGIYPLARGLAAPPAVRALMIGGFVYVALGVCNAIEGKFFTHFFDGRMTFVTLMFLLLGLFLGVAFGWLFGKPAAPQALPHRSPLAWSARLVLAWLSWPLVYLVFGMCVAPIVMPYYNAGAMGLKIPHLSTVLAVQLLRSAIFLAISIPFVAAWHGSRRSLWLSLGWMETVVVALYGLVASSFFPAVLRVAHGAEMTCDGFAYAGLLVLLLAAAPHAAASDKPAHLPAPHPRPL